MTDLETAGKDTDTDGAEADHAGSLATAVLVGALLGGTARASALALLVGIAVTQALLGVAWVFGTRQPGRRGALVIAALAAGASDACVSVWPHSRLGSLLAVCGLAIPAMFVHQLMRGAARVKVVASTGGIALLVLAEVAVPALAQLRHEFGHPHGGQVASGVAVAAAGALVVGHLVDMVLPAPRFDPAVPRGVLAVVASAGLGGSIGYLLLQPARYVDLGGGRGVFIGASVGALVALFAVGAAFALRDAPMPAGRFARRMRPVVGAVLPLCLLAPVAFLLCLAIRA